MDFLLFPLPLVFPKRQRFTPRQLVQGDAEVVGEDTQLAQRRFPFSAFITAVRHRGHAAADRHNLLAFMKPLPACL